MLTNELSMVKTMNHCSGATSFEVEKCIKSPSSPLSRSVLGTLKLAVHLVAVNASV